MGKGGLGIERIYFIFYPTSTMFRFDFHFWKFSPVKTSFDNNAMIGFDILKFLATRHINNY